MVEVRKMKFGNRMYIIFDEFEYYGVKYLMLVEDVSDKLAHDNIFNKNEGTNMIIDFRDSFNKFFSGWNFFSFPDATISFITNFEHDWNIFELFSPCSKYIDHIIFIF